MQLLKRIKRWWVAHSDSEKSERYGYQTAEPGSMSGRALLFTGSTAFDPSPRSAWPMPLHPALESSACAAFREPADCLGRRVIPGCPLLLSSTQESVGGGPIFRPGGNRAYSNVLVNSFPQSGMNRRHRSAFHLQN